MFDQAPALESAMRSSELHAVHQPPFNTAVPSTSSSVASNPSAIDQPDHSVLAALKSEEQL